jgi:hypothetical protein
VAAAAADNRAGNGIADAKAAAWASEWSAWYGQFAARAADQAQKTGRLYQQVADAMSRGELAPTALQAMQAAFYQSRGTTYSERFAELSGRFFSRLVEAAATYSREMAEAVMPGIPAPPPLPRLDPSDANTWFSRLTDYSSSLSTHIATSYKAFLDRVSAGGVDSSSLKEVASEYLERRFPEYLRLLGRLYFDLLIDLNDLRAAGEQDFLSGILAGVGSSRPSGAMTLDLTGPSKGLASATLTIANTREQLAQIRHRVGDVRRADGIGPAFAPVISVTPDQLQLGLSEEGTLTLALGLDEMVYAPNTLYVGAFHIMGHGEPPLEIPLRIMVTSGQSGAVEHPPP